MKMHFHREMDSLRKLIGSLVTQVEENVRVAVESVIHRDAGLADHVIAADERVDQTEVSVEEECLKLIALYHPVADELRFLISILKVNHDLERIGDLAKVIAKNARRLSVLNDPQVQPDLPDLAKQTQNMVTRAIESLLNTDAELARQVWADDQAIDELRDNIDARLQVAMSKHPDGVKSLCCLLAVTSSLERMADHAVNICKNVLYRVEGEIVRHSADAQLNSNGNGI